MLKSLCGNEHQKSPLILGVPQRFLAQAVASVARRSRSNNNNRLGK